MTTLIEETQQVYKGALTKLALRSVASGIKAGSLPKPSPGFKFRMSRQPKVYSFGGLAGCVQRRRCHETGHLVGIYHCAQSGTDGGTDAEDRANPFVTVCEEHGHIVGHRSLALARSHATNPTGWCDTCREKQSCK